MKFFYSYVFGTYADASGSPISIRKDKENYVLSAVIINERNWQIINNDIKKIKIKYLPQLSDEDIELCKRYAKQIGYIEKS